MERRDVIVMGGSAGAHAALRTLLARLPTDLPAKVLVVTHLAPGARSTLAQMLSKDCALPVSAAVDGEPARNGHVYVAVPDRHLIIDDDSILRLTAGPRENRARPAADALFRAAARWCGPRVAGVVLSGSLDDGAAGLAAIAQHGGAALVQDPDEARFPGMPAAALSAVPSAVTAPAAGLARLIAEMAGRPVGDAGQPDPALVWETDMIAEGHTEGAVPSKPIALSCPDCGGGMYEIRTGQAVHYACHVGHSWSPQTFVAATDHSIETALWTAVSAMQEKVTMLRNLAANAERAGDEQACHTYRDESDRVGRDAELIRTTILDNESAADQRPA
ncbi:two-component system chemotaxis response regulator CheB [Actinoplanes octamycinicus]|uniref:protein-glutamate methylesterase n=1 Tax=Actinoplanes octamycinicus TaxID=135948 RepID=A0A7W7H129_9ACTN|nr:chemotaxis protein CheB [Actinoplanes octamycinicus]MBB4742014.1 two-component system chemotaxis response regulator CheB [Actinoplanes octamycinicus]GIE60777.1 chemotaxis protein-glutamate methylesterase [Actinoplanes octamycinicus]